MPFSVKSTLGVCFVACATTGKGAAVGGQPVGSTIFSRQAGYPQGQGVTIAPIHEVITLTPKSKHAGAVRKKIRFGPYTVPGSKEPSIGNLSDTADKLGAIEISNRIESLCGGDCTLLWGVGIPEFENGTALTAAGASIYNHHVFALDLDRQVTPHICPGDPMPGMKSATTVINSQTDKEVTSYTSSDFTLKSGLAIKKTDKIDLLAEFMNYRAERARITVSFDFEYVPGKPKGFLNSQSIMFSATPCNEITFNPPTKQYTLVSKDWIAPADMTLINARGHQHDGGVGMEVKLNGKSICQTMPEYVKIDSRGNQTHYGIKEMSLCEPKAQMKKGDILSIKSDYDIEKYPQRQSNSGMVETVSAMLSVVLGLPADFDLALLQ